MHTPVLLDEVIDTLQVQKGKKYIDATYGLGGYAHAIGQRGGIVLGIDWDNESLEAQRKHGIPEYVRLEHGNFAEIADIARLHTFYPVDGIVFDLGVSMWHYRSSHRGFSYEAFSEPLDMRLDMSSPTTAADIINRYTVDELYGIFTRYSEELDSRTIADAIDKRRRVKGIHTVGELCDVIVHSSSNAAVARIFQALRIVVNNELENLAKGIVAGYDVLARGGRMVVVTFHPTEQRVVKALIREHGYTQIKIKVKNKDKQRFERSAQIHVIEKI